MKTVQQKGMDVQEGLAVIAREDRKSGHRVRYGVEWGCDGRGSGWSTEGTEDTESFWRSKDSRGPKDSGAELPWGKERDGDFGWWRVLGWVAIVALGGMVFGLGAAEADFVEPLPEYAQARELREDSTLHAIAFADQRVGVAVGDRGALLLTVDGGVTWKLRDGGVDCQLCDVVWLNQQQGVAIGGGYDRITGLSRGVVLRTDDGGLHWRRTDDAELPKLKHLRIAADGETLVALGDWSPASGTRGFISSDGGHHWQGEEPPGELVESAIEPDTATRRGWTETALMSGAVRGRCRVSPNQLWAVGDHGLISHSSDGGRTWEVRRGGERQTSVLIVARRPADVPWPLISHEALEFEQRVALLIAETQPDDGVTGSEAERTRQAAVALGAAAADVLAAQVSRPQAGSGALMAGGLMAGEQAWLAAYDDWLAMHRPRVVVVDRGLNSSVREACRRLAVERGIPRVVGYQLGRHGESMLHAGALLPRSGVIARDLWEDALHWVAPDREPAESIALHRVHDIAGSPRRGDSVTAGLRTNAGYELAARLSTAPRRQLQITQARLGEPARLTRLFDTPSSASAFTDGLRMLTAQTAREDRFRLLWAAFRRSRLGSDRSRELAVLEMIAETAGDTSAGHWAALRQQVIRESAEWSALQSFRMGSLQQGAVRTAAEVVPVSPFSVPDSGGNRLAGGFDRASEDSFVRPASATSPVTVAVSEPIELNGTRRSRQTSTTDVDMGWEFHPAVLVSRDASRRRVSDRELQPRAESSADLRRVSESGAGSQWSRLLGSSPTDRLLAPRAQSPPRLDERGDDECWQRVRPYRLRGESGADELTIRVAYDDEFVYFAVTGPADLLRADLEEQSLSHRSRDHELTGIDRLQLRIDTDRDLLSSFSFEMSTSGRTRDSVDGHHAWQPTWYVAPSRGESEVRFELAVLRRDLTEVPSLSGQSWYVSLRSLEAGQRSWDHPLPHPARWLRVTFE